MKNIDAAKKIAVLIDAENAQYSVMGAVLSELSKHGHLAVKKAYGDWSSNHLKNWKQPLNELAITPVQQFSYTQGKNSSDAAMIIDAMDLLYTEQFDAFARKLLNEVQATLTKESEEAAKARRDRKVEELLGYFNEPARGTFGQTESDAYNAITNWLTPRREQYEESARFGRALTAQGEGHGARVRDRALRLLERRR